MKYNFYRVGHTICAAALIAEAVIGAAMMTGGCGPSSRTTPSMVDPALVASADSMPTRKTGQAHFTIYWPTPTRVIPLAAQSVKLTVEQSDPQTGQWTPAADPQIVPRPSSAGASTVKFTGLPVATLRFTATSYPSPDASGVPQAVGTGSLATDDVSTAHDVPITMDSTVVRVEASPKATTVPKGGVSVSVTAFDKDNRVVLTAPSAWRWESSAPSTVLAPTGGTIDGTNGLSTITTILNTLAKGTATITITYTEGPDGSASKATSVITVTDQPPPSPCGTPTVCGRPHPPKELPCRATTCGLVGDVDGYIDGCGNCQPLAK